MPDEVVASPDALTFDKELIDGAWYVVMRIRGQGHLKFSPHLAHRVAKSLIGQANQIENIGGTIILPCRKFRG